MIARNDDSSRMGSALHLNAMHRPGGTPVPFRFHDCRRNVTPLCPRLAVVIAGRDKHFCITTSEGQPNSTRMLGIGSINDGSRITDPHLRVWISRLVLHKLHRSQSLAKIDAPLKHDVDVAVIAGALLAPFRKGQ